MRLILLFIITLSTYASEFPLIFSSAGDEVYKSMQRYNHIKDLAIYQDRPELLEAYCMDANATMQKGFILDKMKDDPEREFDKNLLKEYARDLRSLSAQNELIISQLDDDVGELYEKGDFESLKKINEAGFILSTKMMVSMKKYEDKKELESQLKKINSQELKTLPKPVVPTPVVPVVQVPTKVDIIEKPKAQELPSVEQEKVQVQEALVETKSVPVKKTQKSKEIVYYETTLAALKEELYILRESQEEAKMACLNDITATNYWMIKVLENRQDACERASAIRQMKSYDKAAASSCGRSSLRYVEWHGRIKPYVGKKLFEAEAGCNQ